MRILNHSPKVTSDQTMFSYMYATPLCTDGSYINMVQLHFNSRKPSGKDEGSSGNSSKWNRVQGRWLSMLALPFVLGTKLTVCIIGHHSWKCCHFWCYHYQYCSIISIHPATHTTDESMLLLFQIVFKFICCITLQFMDNFLFVAFSDLFQYCFHNFTFHIFGEFFPL